MRRCCFLHLMKSSTGQRDMYRLAMVSRRGRSAAGKVTTLDVTKTFLAKNESTNSPGLRNMKRTVVLSFVVFR
jgi:hypothetical protein